MDYFTVLTSLIGHEKSTPTYKKFIFVNVTLLMKLQTVEWTLLEQFKMFPGSKVAFIL